MSLAREGSLVGGDATSAANCLTGLSSAARCSSDMPSRQLLRCIHSAPGVANRLDGGGRMLSDTGMERLVRMVPLWTWIVENADRFREVRQNFDRQHRGASA